MTMRGEGTWKAPLGAALAMLLVAAPAAAQTIKIGVITSYSGFLAQAGDSMEKGLALYAKTHEKELPPGVKVELIRRDDASSPDTGKTHAQQLIKSTRVDWRGSLQRLQSLDRVAQDKIHRLDGAAGLLREHHIELRHLPLGVLDDCRTHREELLCCSADDKYQNEDREHL